MTKTTLLLTALPAADALAAMPGGGAELVASLALGLAALVLACLGLRRGITAGERNRALERLLAAEREARQQSEQALAASHDVLCRLVRRQDGARPAPGGTGATGGLRHALERCLAEHAQLHGVRYRFEAGVDPAALPAALAVGRAARLALFEVLQDVLAANAGRNGSADLHVRLSEGARRLALDIQAGAPADQARAPAPLPDALAHQVSALGGILRLAAAAGRPTHWSLTLPARLQPEAVPMT